MRGKVERLPIKMNPRSPTPSQIIIKMPNFKDNNRIIKAARKKQLTTYKGAPRRLSADFSTEKIQGRRIWHTIFWVIKSKNLQPRLPYPAMLSFKMK